MGGCVEIQHRRGRIKEEDDEYRQGNTRGLLVGYGVKEENVNVYWTHCRGLKVVMTKAVGQLMRGKLNMHDDDDDAHEF
jgi:hypothetical protein